MEEKNKIQIFKNVFRGRDDVVTKYWSNTNTHGYSPICRNQWKKGLCKKPCESWPNADYEPLTDQLIAKHLRGGHILGIYPLLKNNTCGFVAADFDNHDGTKDPLKDVIAYFETCSCQDIPCYVFRSRSGTGYHVYIFFDVPIPAWKARAIANALLEEAQVVGDGIVKSSFDKLFPAQESF